MLKKVITLAMVVVASYGYAQNVLTLGKDHAQLITKNFEASNIGTTHRHYYGKIMLNEMLALPNAQKVYVFNGLDGNGQVHLIFKVTNGDGQILNTSYAYDEGLRCPPVNCPRLKQNLKQVGGHLEEGKAQQWVANFQDKYPNRPGVFSFDSEEFKKVLSAKGAEGIVLAYGLENSSETLVLCAFDNDVVNLWDNHLVMSYGEKSSTLYPEQKVVKKN